MLVITKVLTIGQFTFVLRSVIQALLFGGLFLLTSIIFAHAPRISTIETHDVLNRIVGNSTVTISSVKWIIARVRHRRRDPGQSFSLVLAVILALSYGLFGTITDIGLIGLSSCTVPGDSFQDFPASVKSIDDARAIVTANVLAGTDPSTINSYRCDAVQDTICTLWYNSTYGDPTAFRRLNTTDSDVLMPRNVGPAKDAAVGTTYVLLTAGKLVSDAVLNRGLAIIPHDTGVKMIVGVPQLSNQQKVNIPKTLALEIEMGCMKLGIDGQWAANTTSTQSFFTPYNLYNSSTREYTGPDYLEDPLIRTAYAIRDYITSHETMDMDVGPNGLGQFLHLESPVTWATVASVWHTSLGDEVPSSLLANCTYDVYHTLNITPPVASPPLCFLYTMSGSSFDSQTTIRGYSSMVCATTTQLNMVSSLVETDASGRVTAKVDRLPSDLNIVQANLLQSAEFDPIIRFTLSDNPNGLLQHFIQQGMGGTSGNLPHVGLGSIGFLLSTVGPTTLDLGSVGGPYKYLTIMDANFFSSNGFHTKQLTRWAGSLGASYILGSVGYNAWAALDAKPLTVTSTGGAPATCYDQRYGIAFLPLLLAALWVSIWSIHLKFSSRFAVSGKLKEVYGGLAPMRVATRPGGRPPNAILVWEKDPELRLTSFVDGTLVEGNEGETLVEYMSRPGSRSVDVTEE